jgi:hypothetical protein
MDLRYRCTGVPVNEIDYFVSFLTVSIWVTSIYIFYSNLQEVRTYYLMKNYLYVYEIVNVKGEL